MLTSVTEKMKVQTMTLELKKKKKKKRKEERRKRRETSEATKASFGRATVVDVISFENQLLQTAPMSQRKLRIYGISGPHWVGLCRKTTDRLSEIKSSRDL